MDKNAKESNSLDESSRHEFKILLVEGQRERERERERENERNVRNGEGGENINLFHLHLSRSTLKFKLSQPVNFNVHI